MPDRKHEYFNIPGYSGQLLTVKSLAQAANFPARSDPLTLTPGFSFLASNPGWISTAKPLVSPSRTSNCARRAAILWLYPCFRCLYPNELILLAQLAKIQWQIGCSYISPLDGQRNQNR
jgi:hypothetical protein